MCFFLVGKPRSFQFFPTMAWECQSRLGPWDHLGAWLVGAWSTTRRKFLHITGFSFIQPGGLLQLLGEPRSFQLYEIGQAELVLVQSGVVLPLIVNCVVELSVFDISLVAQGMNFLHQRQVGRRWDWRACCSGRILWSSLPQMYLGERSGPEKHLCWCQSKEPQLPPQKIFQRWGANKSMDVFDSFFETNGRQGSTPGLPVITISPGPAKQD